MQVPILIERLPNLRFRASTGFPFNLSEEGASRDEALRNLREQIDRFFTLGREIVLLDVIVPDNPWLRNAGTLDPDDPLVKEWIQIMEENRRKADNDPDFL